MNLRHKYFFIIVLNILPIQFTHANEVVTQAMIFLFSQVLPLIEDDKKNIKGAFKGTKNSDEATIGKFQYKHEWIYGEGNLTYFHFHNKENNLGSLFSYTETIEKPSQKRIESINQIKIEPEKVKAIHGECDIDKEEFFKKISEYSKEIPVK